MLQSQMHDISLKTGFEFNFDHESNLFTNDLRAYNHLNFKRKVYHKYVSDNVLSFLVFYVKLLLH